MGGFLSRLPLRIRITVWVIAIFSVVHVTLSLIVLLVYKQSVDRRINGDLISAAQTVASETAATSRLGLALQVIQDSAAAQWGPLACVVIDSDGSLLNTTGPYDQAVMRSLAAEAGRQLPDVTGTYKSNDDRFVYTMSDLSADQFLIVALPTGHTQRAVEPVAIAFLITLPVGLIAAGIGTWYMSGVAVKPLRQVQQFAEELSAEHVPDLSDIDNAAPEIGDLRDGLEGAMSRIGDGYEQQARFLANVSHELKTPISIVRTEAEVLLASSTDEESLRRFAISTSEEMDRLGRMVESFLLLTRIRQGTARMRAKRHDCNDIVMEAVGHCSGMARQYNVRLQPMLDASDTPPLIEGNADLLQTALGNLIRNAIRFSPQDKPIEIHCVQRSETVVMSVRDFGPGIPEDLVERIFEPFTQADDERRRGRGTGLGLQIAQGIAELHGGDISVENTSPGCRFHLRAPLASATR